MTLQWRDGHCIVKVETLAAQMIFVEKKIENIPINIKTKEKQQCSTCTKQFFFFFRSLVNWRKTSP